MEFIEEISLDMPLLDCLTAYYHQRRAENDFRETSFVAYRTDIRQVVEFMEQRELPPTLRHVTKDLVRRVEAMWTQKGFVQSTIARKLNSLRALVRYCRDFEPAVVDPFAGRRISHRGKADRPDFLSEAEMMKVLGEDTDFGRNPLRNQTLMSLLYYSLCRLSEAAALNWGDVDFRHEKIHLRERKNHDQLTVPMAPELKPLLHRLKSLLPTIPAADAPVFVSEQGCRLTLSGIKKMVAEHGQRNGVPRLHPHLYRHAGITDLLCNGVDLATVARLAGHRSVETTYRYYTHIPDRHAREAVTMFSIIRAAQDTRSLAPERRRAAASLKSSPIVIDSPTRRRERLKGNVRQLADWRNYTKTLHA